MHGSLRNGGGVRRDYHCRHEIPWVRRLGGSASTGTWRHTLGMSAVPGDAAPATRLLHETDQQSKRCSSDVQVTSLVDCRRRVIILRRFLTRALRFSVLSVTRSHGNVRATTQVNGTGQNYPSPHPHPLTDSHQILHTWLCRPYLPTCHIWSRSPQGLLFPI